MCLESLFECGSGFCGASVKGETVLNCGASEGEGPLSESLSVCGEHTESETVRGRANVMRGFVFAR